MKHRWDLKFRINRGWIETMCVAKISSYSENEIELTKTFEKHARVDGVFTGIGKMMYVDFCSHKNITYKTEGRDTWIKKVASNTKVFEYISFKDLSRKFGVNYKDIWDIVRRNSWIKVENIHNVSHIVIHPVKFNDLISMIEEVQ